MFFTYKELIDLAIGSPESGHVNFYALQVLLTCFAQRLAVLDKVVEVQSGFLPEKDLEFRLFAGADAEGEEPKEQAGEEPAEPVEIPPVEETPVKEEPAEEVPVKEEPAEEAPVEEAPVDEAPVKEEPAEEAPDEKAPSENPPAEEAPPATAEVKAEDENHPDKTDDEDTQTLPTPADTQETEADGARVPQITSPGSVVSTRSSHRKMASTIDATVITRLEKRVSLIEMNREKTSMDMELLMNHLKAQLKLTIEQVNNVAHILIDRRRDPKRIKIVRLFAKQLKALTETGGSREVSVSWSSDELEGGPYEEEGLIEDDILEEDYSMLSQPTPPQPEDDLLADMPLGMERMHNDVVYLKSQVCALTNKVNELAAAMVKQDCQIFLGKFEELQRAIQDLHVFQTSTKEITSNTLKILNGAVKQIENLQSSALLLEERKCDRLEMELLMAEKVNFQQLATKVSLQHLEEHKFTLEQMFCEVRHVVSENERNILQIIDNLRMTLGIDAMEVGLKDFRQMIEKRVGMIADALQRYMEMTNDDCAAAAGRVKVLQDLACLSCDSTCLMRTVERQKLPSFPTAKGSVGQAPIVAYDIGQIRGTGVMGYYRKDEFPCSPHAWTKGTSRIPLPKCNPRHAGGVHTIHTAEEHMQKVVLSKRNSGWS
ncbi:uncharacterized protein C16orf96 homolog [Drosophila kikkawai]|uniref:Uncharacterized protein C16orf96 homolog n=1 Tax=Drosophila kikkawai TaxID=30033 RepID=A0A6P4IUF1_DROKI|nr:zinc metalloprotease ZmpB-like [Drosophila kikkawai]